MSYLSWHFGVPKGSKDWSKTLDLSSGGRPNIRGQFQPLLVVPSLKLGFGTCVPHPAAPVRGHGGDVSNDFDCRGRRPRAQSRWARCYRSREEREEKPLSPPLRPLYSSRNIGLSCRPLVVVPMGIVCFCVSRALALF